MTHVDNTFRGELGGARDVLTSPSSENKQLLDDEWQRYNDALDALLAATQPVPPPPLLCCDD